MALRYRNRSLGDITEFCYKVTDPTKCGSEGYLGVVGPSLELGITVRAWGKGGGGSLYNNS